MTALSSGWGILTNLFATGSGMRQISMAAGHLCFLLLSVSTIAGLLVHTRWLSKGVTKVLDEVHQWAGAWTVYTGLIHALFLHFDPSRSMGWAELFLPFATHAHALPLAIGIYGFYAFVAVTVSGHLLGAIKGYLWRWLHWLSFPAWAFSWFHSVVLSHQLRAPWAMALYYGSAVLIVGLELARFVKLPRRVAAAQ
ncbi:MAG TPA: hypothetical protein VK464_06670 [Symbiobacteriaceae bacterium]|nr:hypothetical protein [Symbiobacteriaceae bacterium]